MTYASDWSEPRTGSPDDETIPVFARWIGSWRLSLQRRALSAPQLGHFYDRAAPGWNRTLVRLGVPQGYESLLRGVLRDVRPNRSGAPLRVLDCGVGTGALSCALARVVPAPLALDAIDLSPDMLARAGRGFGEAGIAASLRHGDARDLPYESKQFDLVMTGHMLEHLVDPRLALSEMARVLKPGGLLIACLTRRSALGLYVQLKWRTHRVTPGQAEGWLRDGGLEDVRCLPYGRGTLCQKLSVACIGKKPLEDEHAALRAAATAP